MCCRSAAAHERKLVSDHSNGELVLRSGKRKADATFACKQGAALKALEDLVQMLLVEYLDVIRVFLVRRGPFRIERERARAFAADNFEHRKRILLGDSQDFRNFSTDQIFRQETCEKRASNAVRELRCAERHGYG